MLFWLFVIIFLIGISLLVIGNIHWRYDKSRFEKFLSRNDYEIQTAGGYTSVISMLILITMIVIMCCQYFGVDAQLEKCREQYTAINYKVTSGACRDEFGLLSKEVIDEVQTWNEDLRYYKVAQDNFWIGIFIPNVFDEFETIDYESYNKGE